MIDYGTRLSVNKIDFHDAKVEHLDAPKTEAVPEGSIFMRLDKFAYTANNTTYALVGERIGYWRFFPVPEEGFGIIPCWGFADVIHSKNEQIKEGHRYYGFFPMATHLIAQPGHINSRGFTDMAEPRQGLAAIYNQYVDCGQDPLYQEHMEEMQALVRPLFTTSFLIRDQLVNHKFYNARQIILVSASSKTGLSLASCLKNENVRVIGLTSARNVEFVKSSGYYDSVYTYDQIGQIPQEASAIVDFAGNHSIELAVQNQLEGHLKNVCMVGMVRYEDSKEKDRLPMKPEFFFAPTYAAERIKELGPKEFGIRLSEKYNRFVKDASKWINIVAHKGSASLTDIHHKMTDGKISASDGHIISF